MKRWTVICEFDVPDESMTEQQVKVALQEDAGLRVDLVVLRVVETKFCI